jgi:von Willebrand factor type A domain
MKKRTFVKPGGRRPFPGGVLIEERGEMGATACTMDSYRSIIQGVLLGMVLGAAYLLSGCAKGSGVYGIPVQGERIVFVLDISGSMENKTEDTATGRAAHAITKGAEDELNKYVPNWLTRLGREEVNRQTTKLAGAKRQLIPTINNLPTIATFNVVVFGTGVRLWQRNLVGATQTQKESAIAFLQQLSASGSTDALSALEQTFELREVDQIFFISDGNPTDAQPDSILQQVHRLNSDRRVHIHTVGLGKDQNVDFLQRLASDNQGIYVRH